MGGGCGNAKNVTHTTADSGKKSPAAASRRNTDVIERPDSDSQTESASLHAMQVSHMVGVDAAGMTRSILPGRPGAQHSESGPSRFRCYRCGNLGGDLNHTPTMSVCTVAHIATLFMFG